jgi:hypothetical protein
LNLRISRATRLSSGVKVEGLLEAFNITNHANAITRNTNFGSGAYPTNPSSTFESNHRRRRSPFVPTRRARDVLTTLGASCEVVGEIVRRDGIRRDPCSESDRAPRRQPRRVEICYDDEHLRFAGHQRVVDSPSPSLSKDPKESLPRPWRGVAVAPSRRMIVWGTWCDACIQRSRVAGQGSGYY